MKALFNCQNILKGAGIAIGLILIVLLAQYQTADISANLDALSEPKPSDRK